MCSILDILNFFKLEVYFLIFTFWRISNRITSPTLPYPVRIKYNSGQSRINLSSGWGWRAWTWELQINTSLASAVQSHYVSRKKQDYSNMSRHHEDIMPVTLVSAVCPECLDITFPGIEAQLLCPLCVYWKLSDCKILFGSWRIRCNTYDFIPLVHV